MTFEGLNGFGKPSFPIFQKSDADGFACRTKTHPLTAPQLGNSLISSKKKPDSLWNNRAKSWTIFLRLLASLFYLITVFRTSPHRRISPIQIYCDGTRLCGKSDNNTNLEILFI